MDTNAPSSKQIWLAYAMGITSGVLVTLIYKQARPEPVTQDLREYTAVRDFVGTTFVQPLEPTDVLTRAMRGLASSLDPYSRYYDQEESRKLGQETAGNYPGIGVILRRMDGRQRILFCMPESPAMSAGLRSGDEIVKVDGVLAAKLSRNDFSAAMRGPEGSLVNLDLMGLDGLERSIQVQRALVPDPSVRHAEMLPGQNDIAYLNIHTFSRRTPEEFDAAMERLAGEGMRGLILDLRGNLGGVMEAAVHIVDRFLPSGLILRTQSRRKEEKHMAKAESTLWPDLPIVVLIDGDTASASEILAGALQDHRRAALVGEPTYGKGMVQTIRQFPEFGTRIKVTSAYYYSPSGRLFERSAEEGREFGIVPDVQLMLGAAQARESAIFRVGYAPPLSARESLALWQESEEQTLIPEVPKDEHLVAALELFRGERPSAQREKE